MRRFAIIAAAATGTSAQEAVLPAHYAPVYLPGFAAQVVTPGGELWGRAPCDDGGPFFGSTTLVRLSTPFAEDQPLDTSLLAEDDPLCFGFNDSNSGPFIAWQRSVWGRLQGRLWRSIDGGPPEFWDDTLYLVPGYSLIDANDELFLWQGTMVFGGPSEPTRIWRGRIDEPKESWDELPLPPNGSYGLGGVLAANGDVLAGFFTEVEGQPFRLVRTMLIPMEGDPVVIEPADPSQDIWPKGFTPAGVPIVTESDLDEPRQSGIIYVLAPQVPKLFTQDGDLVPATPGGTYFDPIASNQTGLHVGFGNRWAQDRGFYVWTTGETPIAVPQLPSQFADGTFRSAGIADDGVIAFSRGADPTRGTLVYLPSDTPPCNPADVTTTAADFNTRDYFLPDGAIDGADLAVGVERWLTLSPLADINTKNVNPGEAGYGSPDGEIDGADLSYFVEQWIGGCP